LVTKKGSFTGAHAEKKGLFEIADRGTLFLDEIAELDWPCKGETSARAAERKIRRVGGTHEIGVDVRVIAATNRDLRAMVSDGRFRMTFITASMVCQSTFRHCVNGAMTFPVLIDYFALRSTRATPRACPRVNSGNP